MEKKGLDGIKLLILNITRDGTFRSLNKDGIGVRREIKIQKKIRLESGKSIPIPSIIKQGMSSEELYFETKIRAIRNQLIHGFAPKEYIKLGKMEEHFPTDGDVMVMVLGFYHSDFVRLLFPGELLTPSNPVFVERKHLESLPTISK